MRSIGMPRTVTGDSCIAFLVRSFAAFVIKAVHRKGRKEEPQRSQRETTAFFS